ncbi:MAG: tetratricopeptide repeat protein [Deltaproteobacteria bacterium]|nr:tetratricopeptide repeat protein [Deltaproteobacteria bacterium]
MAASETRRWLYGPIPDLLLGCGAGHALVILLFFVPIVQNGVDPWLVLGAGLLSLFTNTPHYGATLLRVYEQREERQRFAIFTVWITIALCGLFVAGLHYTLLGSLLVTIYATWSPWHFSGQNYGLALMLMRRRGVDVDPGTKRLLYTSFILCFALTALLLHTESGAIGLAPVPAAISGEYSFLSLGIGSNVANALFPLIGVAYLGTLGLLGKRLLALGSLRDLAPAAMLVATQALWFSLPALLRYTNAFTTTNIAFGAFGISIAHSVQYLWISSYYAANAAHRARLAPYLGKTVLAGCAVVVFPGLIFAPALLGTVPYNAGLGILLFAVVNLHHFLLDGAIWKLRDGLVAKVLLRSPSEATAASPDPVAPPGRLRPLVWAVGAIGLLVAAFYSVEVEFGINRALRAQDLERVETATRNLRWIGREDFRIHQQLADAMARRTFRSAVEAGSSGPEIDCSDAQRHYEESLRIHASVEAWLGLPNVHYTLGDYPAAHASYAAALDLDPRHFRSHNRLGELWLTEGKLVRARASLERAAALAPKDTRTQKALDRLADAERAGS